MTETHSREDVQLVGASETALPLGRAGGAKGDHLVRIIISPKTGAPGVVTILDGAVSYPIYYGGTDATLRPVTVELGLFAKTLWKVTTGTNVQCLAVGRFT